MPWPWSVPFYTFGAIFLEFLLRLGALCILVWLVHVVLLRHRWLMPTFWAVNVVVASYEIQPSVIQAVAARDWGSVALAPLEPLYWTNIFRRLVIATVRLALTDRLPARLLSGVARDLRRTRSCLSP